MTQFEEYEERYLKNGVEERNAPFLQFADLCIYTEALNRHNSNNGDHPIAGLSNDNNQLNLNLLDYNNNINNNNNNSHFEDSSESENAIDMFQYENKDSYEGLNGYETFCDEKT